MTLPTVTFTDPRTAATYTWEINVDSEQPAGKEIAIERTSNTGNTGAVRQQGDDGDLIFDWTINVLSGAMELALWQWYALSRLQTIYVTDWDGDQYEGQIILVKRVRKSANAGWSIFQLQFDVYRLISGMLADAGITP